MEPCVKDIFEKLKAVQSVDIVDYKMPSNTFSNAFYFFF